ncbi:MAG: hypothetical protein ACE149_19585 [Armatimonadota bacterium]
MTKHEIPEFRRLASNLARRLRVSPEPTDEDLLSLSAALEDIPLPLLQAAADQIYQTSDGFWPRPVEWRRTVDAIQVERQKAGRLKPDLRGVPETYCERCDDTGWEERACPGAGPQVTDAPKPPASWLGREWWGCERNSPHYPHSYAVECKCRDQNPRYQEKHAPRPKSYAEPAERRERRPRQGGWTRVIDAADRWTKPGRPDGGSDQPY